MKTLTDLLINRAQTFRGNLWKEPYDNQEGHWYEFVEGRSAEYG